jgi:hypothetical protein
MRAILAVFAVIAGLSLSDPSLAQGTASPTATPSPLPAPVGHRQPRRSDVPASRTDGESADPSAAAPATPTRPDPNDPDERLNRLLNICRGC